MATTTDVVVVGLGAMGSAALYQLARRRVRAIGIDRFAPPHERGSSHGESRITRQAIGEGGEYVPFALRSHEIWRELEGATGGALLFPVGGLLLGRARGSAQHHGQADFIGETIAAAERYGIVHDVLDAAETQARFPQFRLAGNETVYYEPGAGFLRPERCIATQLYRARALGATMRTNETVVRIAPSGSGVEVVTGRETYSAGHAVVAAGAWLPALLGGPFPALLKVYRQVLHWFAPEEPAAFTPEQFPIFIWIHGAGAGDYFYGFPVITDGVKLAAEQFTEAADPERGVRAVAADESAVVYATHVRGRIAGVTDRCLRSSTCVYTVTPDSGFVIDRHPDCDRIVVASPCFGHGFKHSAAIGESIAELVTSGAPTLDLAPFSLARRRPLV
jgi:sarcosine oxidase